MANARTIIEDRATLFPDVIPSIGGRFSSVDLNTYNEMSTDSTISGILESIKIPIQEATYDIRITPKPKGNEKEIGDFIYSVLLEQTDWTSFLESAVNCQVFGFQAFEIILRPKMMDGVRRYVIKELRAIPSTTLTEVHDSRDQFGRIKFLVQTARGRKIRVQRGSMIIITVNGRSPEDWRGRSPLLPVYEKWWMKRKLWLLQGKALEKHGLGIDVITSKAEPEDDDVSDVMEGDRQVNESDSSSSEKADDTLKQLMKISQGKAGHIYLPPNFDYKIVERSGDFPEILKTIDKLDDDIADAFVATHLKSGSSGKDFSKAATVQLSDIFLQLVKGRAQQIVNAVNKQLVKLLVDMNFGEQQRYPKLVVSNVNESSAKDFFLHSQYNPILPKIPQVGQWQLDTIGIQVPPAAIEKAYSDYSANENRQQEKENNRQEKENNNNNKVKGDNNGK